MSMPKVFKWRVIERFAPLIFIVSLLCVPLPLTALLYSMIGSPPHTNINTASHAILARFSSYEELKTFLNRSWNSSSKITITTWAPLSPRSPLLETMHMDISVEYSRTNIQVEGVDEADIVKTDGRFIYLALGRRVLVIEAYPPEEAKVSAEITINGTVSGLFINNKRLVIISSSDVYYVEILGGEGLKEDRGVWSIGLQTSILIYNVEDPAQPTLIRNVTISGAYFNSRMIGDYVYALASSPAFLVNGEPLLPEIFDGMNIVRVDPTHVYYSNRSDFYNAFSIITAINIRDPSESITYETFLLGYASCIYVSLNNVYVAVPVRYSESGEFTEIHRIHIEGGKISYEASGAVPGTILNQFSMDEYDGHFRIATLTYRYEILKQPILFAPREEINSNVYVLNMSLAIIGRLEGLAPGEHMYSARFMGDRCYLVTFKKVDPLFVIGLENPSNPRVLGKLKIPGYSDYLHPYNDNYLIGIGKWTIEAEEGDFAWYQGVKISLFDVSDVEHPKEVDSFIIGDRGTESPVLHDHKALLFDRDLNLLAMPVLVAEIDESKYPRGVPPDVYGDYVWQGLYIFNVTEKNITLRGGITHISDMEEFLRSGYGFYSEYAVERALYIGNILYTISSKMIKMNDIWSLEEIGIIKLQ